MTITIKVKNGTPVQKELSDMMHEAYLKASGTKGFCNPDIKTKNMD